MNSITRNVDDLRGFHSLTRHARKRISARRLSYAAVQRVLEYGRVFHARGATIYAIGRKEVARFRLAGIDLTTEEGVQVVCRNDAVMTAYRNHDFRGLRPRRRRRRRRRIGSLRLGS